MTVPLASAPPALASVAALLAERAGIAFGPHSSDGLARAARRVMARHQIPELELLAQRLRGDRACWESLLDEVTVGETYFFRNPEHFELLRARVLPALLRARGASHTLQVWSAGCATGEEAYSLAMVLDGEGLLERARVIGSDIAPGALEKARNAYYREWSLRGLDPQIQARWLQSEHGQTRVCERIRRSVRFLQLNLAEASYPSPQSGLGSLDLIFCRNVLIYFDPATIAAVERRLFAALAPGGWLIAGPSDPMLGKHAGFEVVITDHGLCYRRPGVPELDLELAQDASGPLHAYDEPDPAAFDWQERASAVDDGAAHADGDTYREPRADDHEPPAAVPADTLAPARERESAATHVRAVWSARGAHEGLIACDHALVRDAMSAELHYLRAVLLIDLGRDDDALQAARRTLYLESGLAIAQFTLGSILERAGRAHAARRPYANAYEATIALPANAPLPLAEGVRAGALAAAAANALARLGER